MARPLAIVKATRKHDSDMLHRCPTCKLDFRVEEKRHSPHVQLFVHLSNAHQMRVNVACHPICIWKKSKQ